MLLRLIGVVLGLIWFAGVTSGQTMGGLVHVLLAVSFMAVLSRFVRIRRTTDLAKVRNFQQTMSGRRCHICGELFVGLAMDCRCTNWGQ